MLSKIILNSLKGSFSAILKNKKTFFLVFILQLLFFFLVLLATAVYISNIVINSQNILEYAEKLNLNPKTASFDMLQQKSPLGDDPLLISRNYDEIIKNFVFLLLFIFIIFSLVNGLAWYFASGISDKNLFSLKNIFYYLSKFFMISLFFIPLIYFFLYNILNVAFSKFLSKEPKSYIPLAIIALILIYFIYILMPILGKIKLKGMAKKSFSIGTKNFIPVTVSYLIIISLIALSFLLIYYLINLNLLLLLIAFVLAVFVFSWGKVYFTVVVRKLSGL